MKIIKWIAVIVVWMTITMLISIFPVLGETYSDQAEEPIYPYGDILQHLLDDAKKLLPLELQESNTSSEILSQIDGNYMWEFTVTIIQDGLVGCLKLFASVLGLILVCGVLTRLSDLFFTDKSALMEFAILLICALQIYTSVYSLFDLTQTMIEQINGYMSALITVLCGIFLWMGNSGVALLSTTWMGLLWTVAEKLCFSILSIIFLLFVYIVNIQL